MTPRVSVVVPTRDRADALRRALASVDAQRFRDFEVLVVDDNSVTGGTAWLADEWPTVRVCQAGMSGGAAAARNRGIAASRGEFIAFLDDDDVWHPNYLGIQVANLDAQPRAALSYADHVELGISGRVHRPDTLPLLTYSSPLMRLLTESYIHTLSVVVCRRGVFDRVGLFDESLTVVHDLDWYCRALSADERFVPMSLAGALVVRSVPGGLVTSHRQWRKEERALVDRVLAQSTALRGEARMVRAYRSLFFARVALGNGDLAFGASQLATALNTSPYWTLAVAARRVLRRIQRNGVAEWDPAGVGAP